MSESSVPVDLPPWLAQFCADKDASSVALKQPFTFRTPDGELTCATNGHRLIALSVPSGFPPAPDSMRYGLSIVTAPVVGVPIALARLRAFLVQHVPETTTCLACGGAGGWPCGECDETGVIRCECTCGHEHDAPCAVCDGAGKAPCEECHSGRFHTVLVRIGRNLYDARYFARPIDALAGDIATFMEDTGVAARARLVGDGWQLIVMARRDVGGDAEPVGTITIDELQEAANV